MSQRHLPTPVSVALRVYAERTDREARAGSRYIPRGWPADVLVLDVETTTDALQRLTFGSYRHCKWSETGEVITVAEGLIYADDLPERNPAGYAELQRYVPSHRAEVAQGYRRRLRLVSATEFLNDVFYYLAFKARALVVGFNLPFDLTRFAVKWGNARGKYYGGFSLMLWHRLDEATGEVSERSWMPRVWLKVLDSKRAFTQFVKPKQLDPSDAEAHDDGKQFVFGGNFLDARTLAFALTSASHSLKSACEAYGVTHAKFEAVEHGRITSDYIGYNRCDVLATGELLVALRREVDAHPVALNPSKTYSPATVAKAYLHALGVTPPGQQFSGLPREVYGVVMNAYYGGRAECRIRNTPVPVVHTDFVSMYPTVNALMELWSIITASELAVEDCRDEAQRLLARATVDSMLDPNAWQELAFFAEIEPDEDVLPVRASYDVASAGTNIGVNPFTSPQGQWYAGPDLVAAKLLGGKPPAITRAIRLTPRGQQPGLKPVRLGSFEIHPATQDFFRAIIEERKRVEADDTRSAEDRKAASQALKILANAGSYGVFVEMNSEDLPKDETAPVRVYSHGVSFESRIHKPESAGEYFFPPVGVLITAGARLMLALLERMVTDAGGTYAFCDTDSMAIVASERGGLVRCEGGPERTDKNQSAVRALSWRDVEAIVRRFTALNPYNASIVPGSVLRIEGVNYDSEGDQRQLYAVVISAKRYVLFTRDGRSFSIEKASEHGLGHLMNPYADRSDGNWIEEVWSYIVGKALGLKPPKLPAFAALPALSRITVTSPHVLKPFGDAQQELSFAERIRPMNFVLSATVKRFGHPVGVDPTRFHLVRPFTRDLANALTEPWIDLYSGHEFRVTTDGTSAPDVAQLKSYGDVLTDYMTHSETKSADVNGEPCKRETRGLLQRRSVVAENVRLVGKETNRLEDVENGLVHDWDDVMNVYYYPSLDPWRTTVLPQLKAIPARVLAEAAGISTRAVRALRNGHYMPSPETREAIQRFIASRAANAA